MGGRSQVHRVWGCALGALLLASCTLFDRDRLQPLSGGGQGGSGGSGGSGASGADAGVCVPKPEICNGVDDDCDGLGDVEDDDAHAWCEPIVINAETRCAATSAGVLCVRVRCDEGYLSCDGDPSNGCEERATTCEVCPDCEDGGDEDGGE